MATIEDVNDRTLLQQFHSLYKKQDAIETNVENVDAKVEQEATARADADAGLQSSINANATSIANLQNSKVDKETGKGLSTNDFTNEYKTKIDTNATNIANNTTQITALQKDKQDKLTAGANITIDANNVIRASGGLTKVVATDVDSESATQGQVLTADGSGGASWQNASGGNIYLHNIQLGENFHYSQFYIISKSNTTFTFRTLKEWLYNNGFRSAANVYGIGKFRGLNPANNISKNWQGMYCEYLSAPVITIYATFETYTIVDNAIKITNSAENGGAFDSFTDSVIEL